LGLPLLAAALWTTPSDASDHADDTVVAATPALDIADLFVFRSTDADDFRPRTVFVMTVNPDADANSRFDPLATYEFVITQSNAVQSVISCTADDVEPQSVTCTLPDGSSSTKQLNDTTDGNRAAGVKLVVFAGLRDDPTFVDLTAVRAVQSSIESGTPDPTPLTDGTGTDSFAGQNVLALVVDVENTVLPDEVVFVSARVTR
jgi:hypothetical protein